MSHLLNHKPTFEEMLSRAVIDAARPQRDRVLRSMTGTHYQVNKAGTFRRIDPKPLSKKARWRMKNGGQK